MRYLLILLLITATTTACTTAEVAPPEGKRSINVMVGMYGFFNSEDTGKFSPKPIDYVTVSSRDAHSAIVEYIQLADTANTMQVLSWQKTLAIVDQDNAGKAQARLVAALDVIDAGIQTGEIPGEQAIKLKSPMQLPESWNADDRVLVVVGLETVRRAQSRGLTSALGCVWFSGDGNYFAVKIAGYDFTQFDTDKLAATVTDNCF